MGDERLTRAASVLVVWLLCVLIASTVLAQQSHAAVEDDPSETSDPTELSVPHLGELGLSINAAWTLQECPQLPASPWIALECSPEAEVTLRALAYSPTAGPWPLVVSVIDSLGQPRDLTYTVVLADPEPPAVVTGALPLVGVAGGRTLVPISSLVTECIQCALGVSIAAVVSVDPNVAPSAPPSRAWIAQNHLVIDAPADATEVTIALLVADDTGVWGAPSEFTLPLRKLKEPGAVALHRTAVVTSGSSLELTLDDFLIAEATDAWTIDRCGEAVTGTVVCDDAQATYVAGPSVGLADQFWLVLRSDAGDAVVASLTVTTSDTAGSAPVALGWAPAAVGSATAAVAIPTPRPGSTEPDASNPGALSSLWSVLPRLNTEEPPDEETTP